MTLLVFMELRSFTDGLLPYLILSSLLVLPNLYLKDLKYIDFHDLILYLKGYIYCSFPMQSLGYKDDSDTSCFSVGHYTSLLACKLPQNRCLKTPDIHSVKFWRLEVQNQVSQGYPSGG